MYKVESSSVTQEFDELMPAIQFCNIIPGSYVTDETGAVLCKNVFVDDFIDESDIEVARTLLKAQRILELGIKYN
jgi:hypothetical protein